MTKNTSTITQYPASPVIAAKHMRHRKVQKLSQPIGRVTSDASNTGNVNANTNNQESFFKDVHLKLPSVILAALLNLMMAIPFGVSYFPIEWGNSPDAEFPLAGKEALGIRMFLFSTIVGQLVFTKSSGFPSAIGLQMVENVPFCHSLALLCINEQGYGKEALSTLFFLFGFASILVGIVFYSLGHFEMGNVVYFFPHHVLIGCIGGLGMFEILFQFLFMSRLTIICILGIFVGKVAVEVATNTEIKISSLYEIFVKKFNLVAVVILFEAGLRILTYLASKVIKDKKSNKLSLLAPLYYCSITPVFYFTLYCLGVSHQTADDAGFFFPSMTSTTTIPEESEAKIWDKDLLDIWTVVNFSTVSWVVLWKSIPTLLSLVAFSLIHVPINIPALSVSTKLEADMNKELKGHGYSNFFSGMFGGLQNYLGYTNSVLYFKTGGGGELASYLIVLITIAAFIYGPTAASYIPRCMAGTLLLHVGIDLLVEGVIDSYGSFDTFEYSSVWLITLMMSAFGMEAALITGVVTALLTYVIQTIHYQNPIKGAILATTLRSSVWVRPAAANAILEDRRKGRRKIFFIQLQGHIFFGNAVKLTENVKNMLKDKTRQGDVPWIVILDFSRVLGIDSSAAQNIAKLRKKLRNSFGIQLAIFVTGSKHGFPTSFNLSDHLRENTNGSLHKGDLENGILCIETSPLMEEEDCMMQEPQQLETEERISLFRTPSRAGSNIFSLEEPLLKQCSFPSDIVCETIDQALTFAEDALIALVDPNLLEDQKYSNASSSSSSSVQVNDKSKREKEAAIHYLKVCCQAEPFEDKMVKSLFALFEREVWKKNDILWRENSRSTCLKMLVSGSLVSTIDNIKEIETIPEGSILGELGLVTRLDRLTTVKCLSDNTIVYNLKRETWDKLVRNDPALARLIDRVVIRYLSNKVQHVSNRVFETRCLPI